MKLQMQNLDSLSKVDGDVSACEISKTDLKYNVSAKYDVSTMQRV